MLVLKLWSIAKHLSPTLAEQTPLGFDSALPAIPVFDSPHSSTSPSGLWTYLSIGTPPQAFRAQLHFDWHALFVPSVSCYFPLCQNPRYNRSLFKESVSSTFATDDVYTELAYTWGLSEAPTQFKGVTAKDVVTLGGLKVAEVDFLDAFSVEASGFFTDYVGFDIVLGLAPFDLHDATPDSKQLRSPIEIMMRRKSLGRNMFSLTMPSGMRLVDAPSRAPGKLVLGSSLAIDDLHNTVSVPTHNSGISKGSWHLPLTNITWNEDITYALPPNTTLKLDPKFDPDYADIKLPAPLAATINKHISLPRKTPYAPHEVDCSTREALRTLVYTFANGARLSLGGYDYTMERGYSNGTSLGCLSLIGSVEEGEEVLTLGGGGMEGFVTEWDLDAMEVRFSSR